MKNCYNKNAKIYEKKYNEFYIRSKNKDAIYDIKKNLILYIELFENSDIVYVIVEKLWKHPKILWRFKKNLNPNAPIKSFIKI